MLLSNCENEKFDIVEPKAELSKGGTIIEHLTSNEVPEIIDKITNVTGKSSSKSMGSAKTIDYNKAHIEIGSVLKVKNQAGVTNYTFGVVVEDTPINVFYNVIVNENPNGKLKDPYVLKYVVSDDALANFIANDGDFGYFKGMRYMLPLDGFLDDGISFSRTSGDCPDDGTPIDNTGDGGNGGFYDIDKYNFIQTDPTYYQYADYTTAPQSYSLYFNSYNTTTNDPTSHVDQVTDQLVPISTSQSGPMEIYVPNSIIAGVITVPVTATVSAWYETTQGMDGSGSGNCMMTVTLTHADGTKTSFDISCALPNQLRTSAATTATDCPDGEVEGEIGIVKPGKGCAFFGDYVDGGDDYCYPLSSYVDPIVACVGTLTQEQVDWLNDAVINDHGEDVLALYNYLDVNGCHQNTAGFAKEVIDAGLTNSLVIAFPLIQYPIDLAVQYKQDYPKLTEYLTDQLPKVADIPLIVNTINSITGLSIEQIKHDLRWNQGPTIYIVQLDNFGTNTTEKTVGFFKAAEPNNIYLDIDYVNGLEHGSVTQYQKDALLFYLGTTILHEYVHYADNLDGIQYPGEEGQLFEILVYGENVTSENAALILNRD